MASRKKKAASDSAAQDATAVCSMTNAGRFVGHQESLALAVSIRQQTPSEERRFAAALHLFLAELVRQGGRRGDNHV